MSADKELSIANGPRDARHNGHDMGKNRNYRHASHCVNIFPSFLTSALSSSFFSALISRTQFLFLPSGDLTPRIRYSIGRAVVDLIEHKGFRYSSSAICNRATYPIKSSYAVDCIPTQRQTLDKFYSLLLHSCIVRFLRVYYCVSLKFIYDMSCVYPFLYFALISLHVEFWFYLH